MEESKLIKKWEKYLKLRFKGSQGYISRKDQSELLLLKKFVDKNRELINKLKPKNS